MITFAVAAYNVEKYIATCIDSILSQSSDNFEIIVIDDGSTDNTAKICDEYLDIDNRVRVIHQQNSGISAVRNLAIKEAKGDFICFIDGDDKLSDSSYNTILQNVTDDFDIVYFDAQFFVYDNVISAYVDECEPLVLYKDGIRDLWLSTMYSSKDSQDYVNKTLRSVWGKAIKTEFLRQNNILFEGGLVYGEDVVFNLDCLKKASTVKLVRKPVYFYRQRQTSVIHRYNANIAENNKSLSQQLGLRAQDSSEMLSRYYMRCISDLRAVVLLDMCHKDNPKPYAHKKADYEAFLDTDWCKTAMNNVDVSGLKDNDSHGLMQIRNNDFDAMLKIYKKRDRKEKVKILINKLRLTKILKPIRDTIKGK